MRTKTLFQELLPNMDAYWRAINYLPAGPLYDGPEVDASTFESRLGHHPMCAASQSFQKKRNLEPNQDLQ
jgi:phosphoketolase